MNPHPPGCFPNFSTCPNEPSQIPDPKNFNHSQFPQHMPFCQSSHAMNFPHQQFPQHPVFPPNYQVVFFNPQYAPYSLAPPPPPPPPAGVVPSASISHLDTPPCSVTGPEEDIASIENDDNAKPERTARRMAWTEQEDLRLISAWLSNSKKRGMYWGEVAVAYNRTTPRDRRRVPKQLKVHWQKITKKIAHFFDCWCRVKAKYPSGQSDNIQLMDITWVRFHEEAREMYHDEAKHYFTLDHCWKAVWDQPKWKAHISSLPTKRTKLSEYGDYTTSSEDMEDMPEEETCQVGCVMANEKLKDEGVVSPYSSDVQEDIDQAVDPQTMLKKDHVEMTEVHLHFLDENPELDRLKQPETKNKELLMADTSRFDEIRMSEHESTAKEVMPKKETHPLHCKVPDQERAVRRGLPEKASRPHGCKVAKMKRKGEGKVSSCSDVQEDIERFVYLQNKLKKDRQEMSAVQLRLSNENLESARLKREEAKYRKETVLCEKYTELLIADMSRLNEFQKAEYQIAVRRMGQMLYSKDGGD